MLHRFILCAALLAGTLLLVPDTVLASEGDEETLDALHHQVDAYYLDFAPFGKVELPRIFIVRRASGSLGFDLYGSTQSAVDVGGYEPHFEEGAVHTSLLDAHLEAPGGGHVIADLSFTKHLIFAWIGMILVLLIFLNLAGRYKQGVGRDTPPNGKFQNLFETLVVFVRNDIARPNLGDKTDKYLPYLLTAFFFILTCNLLGLVPFGATATSNLMITAVLATITFLLTQFGGSKDYWMHIFNPPGVPAFVKPILIPVELMGILTKPVALAIRLFANMTAGHMVILSLIGLIFSFNQLFGAGVGFSVAPISVAFTLFILLLELLVAFIQAYVFTMLSALFIGMAVAEHDHHDDHAHDAAAKHTALSAHDGLHDAADTSVKTPEPALAV